MKIFVSGACEAQNIFTLVDPTSFSEKDFELHTLGALRCVYPDYHCVPFRGGFEFDGHVYEADLALVHKNLTHWFVLEIELVSHSLYAHVIPQVRSFRYGKPLSSCVDYLCRFVPGLSEAHAESLVRFVPYSVAVVANRAEPDWATALRSLDVQFMTVSVFNCCNGNFAHETEGSLYVPHLSLGFYNYSAADRSIRLDHSCGLAEGVVQMEDPSGSTGLWTIRATEDALWVTKNTGDPGLPDNRMLQVLKTQTGKLTLRLTASRY